MLLGKLRNSEIRPQEVWVIQPRLILAAAIAKNGHDGMAGAKVLGDFYRRSEIDTGAGAKEPALLMEQSIHHVDHFLIVHLNRVIDLRRAVRSLVSCLYPQPSKAPGSSSPRSVTQL